MNDNIRIKIIFLSFYSNESCHTLPSDLAGFLTCASWNFPAFKTCLNLDFSCSTLRRFCSAFLFDVLKWSSTLLFKCLVYCIDTVYAKADGKGVEAEKLYEKSAKDLAPLVEGETVRVRTENNGNQKSCWIAYWATLVQDWNRGLRI